MISLGINVGCEAQLRDDGCYYYHCSLTTPPGTKVKIKEAVLVVNGFMLLKKTSMEVLGGNVEALLKKWNLQKVSF